ncbi:MAG: hypothetical protein QOF81_2571, partial [Acidimicrobiaceae bacterium]|nr:hypothetical protein [Acidimicrobiaceae bacterium]
GMSAGFHVAAQQEQCLWFVDNDQYQRHSAER